MITTFEEITIKLTDEEIKLIPMIVWGFNCHEDDVISSNEICDKINLKIGKKFLTGVRLRKLVHYIVLNRLTRLPLIANSKGYYITANQKDIDLHVTSLLDRMDSIKARYDSVKNWKI